MYDGLKMQLFVQDRKIYEFNSVYSEVVTIDERIIRINKETNEPEYIEIKSKDDKNKVLLVQDRFGKYLRLTYKQGFNYMAHKNDGDIHLFVFKKDYGGYYFVYKTWTEIEELAKLKGMLIDDQVLVA
jgi:hypothetical protein